jgi:SAM-dependent methyltransferase
MPSRSNVSDSQSFDRAAVTEDLYLLRGAQNAACRCDVNSRLGDFDLLEALLRILKLVPGEIVFDVGCGAGQHLMRFQQCVQPGGRARGFDISADAVQAARQRGGDAEVADAASLPVPAVSADALTSNFAIYYHPRLSDVIVEWSRVLKPGGRIAISGPAADTNQELYRFHREVTGGDPSDADRMALGYVDGPVRKALAAAAFANIELEIATNHVRFPDAPSFLAYWKSTSLFARTPHVRYEAGEARLAGASGPFTVTKRVAILSATAGERVSGM